MEAQKKRQAQLEAGEKHTPYIVEKKKEVYAPREPHQDTLVRHLRALGKGQPPPLGKKETPRSRIVIDTTERLERRARKEEAQCPGKRQRTGATAKVGVSDPTTRVEASKTPEVSTSRASTPAAYVSIDAAQLLFRLRELGLH